MTGKSRLSLGFVFPAGSPALRSEIGSKKLPVPGKLPLRKLRASLRPLRLHPTCHPSFLVFTFEFCLKNKKFPPAAASLSQHPCAPLSCGYGSLQFETARPGRTPFAKTSRLSAPFAFTTHMPPIIFWFSFLSFALKTKSFLHSPLKICIPPPSFRIFVSVGAHSAGKLFDIL